MRGDGLRRAWPAVAALVVLAAVVLAVVAVRPGTQPGTPGPSGTPAVSIAGPISYVEGLVTAGPVCPVARSPEPSECAPRPVAGAVLVASNPGQGEVARATSGADGSYRLTIYGFGSFTLTALPVQGLMRAPAPVTVTLVSTETKRVDFEYDTGIR
jgi:hypothetical protein